MAANENWLKSLNKYSRSGSFGFSGFQIISFGFVREAKFEQTVFGFRSFGLNSFSDQLWSMRKMGKAIIHAENIWLARLFRRSAAMLTHYAVSLVLYNTPAFG